MQVTGLQKRSTANGEKSQVNLLVRSFRKSPFLPRVVREWRDNNPGEAVRRARSAQCPHSSQRLRWGDEFQ